MAAVGLSSGLQGGKRIGSTPSGQTTSRYLTT